MTNFDRVEQWMTDVGQIPIALEQLDKVLERRETLIDEEYTEVMMSGKDLYPASCSKENLVDYLKELADLLVVTYGAFADLGINADEVFKIVQDENDKKVQHKEVREDGKIIVNPEVKAKLKQETKERLSSLVEQVPSSYLWSD